MFVSQKSIFAPSCFYSLLDIWKELCPPPTVQLTGVSQSVNHLPSIPHHTSIRDHSRPTFSLSHLYQIVRVMRIKISLSHTSFLSKGTLECGVGHRQVKPVKFHLIKTKQKCILGHLPKSIVQTGHLKSEPIKWLPSAAKGTVIPLFFNKNFFRPLGE